MSIVLGLIGFALLIVFWVKIAGCSARLDTDDRGKRDWDRGFDEPDDDRRDFPMGPTSDGIKAPDPGRYQ